MLPVRIDDARVKTHTHYASRNQSDVGNTHIAAVLSVYSCGFGLELLLENVLEKNQELSLFIFFKSLDMENV